MARTTSFRATAVRTTFGTLAGGLQPLGERLQRRVEAAGRQRRHVQHAADHLAASGDPPRAAPPAAVVGHRRHPHQRRRLAVGRRPQLGARPPAASGSAPGPPPGCRAAGRPSRATPGCCGSARPARGRRPRCASRASAGATPGRGGPARRRSPAGCAPWSASRSAADAGPASASSSRAASSGRGLGSARVTAAKWASTRASRASVLARWPIALAKSRTWRGLTTSTGRPAWHSAAAAAASRPPVASSTTRRGRSGASRATSSAWPSGVLATVKTGASPTAKSSLALETSMPTNVSGWGGRLHARSCPRGWSSESRRAPPCDPAWAAERLSGLVAGWWVETATRAHPRPLRVRGSTVCRLVVPCDLTPFPSPLQHTRVRGPYGSHSHQAGGRSVHPKAPHCAPSGHLLPRGRRRVRRTRLRTRRTCRSSSGCTSCRAAGWSRGMSAG